MVKTLELSVDDHRNVCDNTVTAIPPMEFSAMTLHNELAAFAARFNISAADAYVLPALFERTAQMAKMPVRALLSQATFTNNALGEYLANACRKIAAEDQAGA